MRPSQPAVAAALMMTIAACTDSGSYKVSFDSSATGAARSDSARPLASPGGFTEPEAVRYDPDQDLYFVSNWGTGATEATDNNGFISRVRPDGAIDSLRFIAGGRSGVTLHSPRGMAIVGDTLWVVDVDAVRGFDRRTGAPLASADFSRFERGFLNDIAAGGHGLYVTDTGTDHIYRIAAGVVTVALKDSTLGGPNGITADSGGSRFIVVPFGGDSVIRAWTAGGTVLTEVGRSSGGRFDGVEILPGDRVLVASQKDSSLYLFTSGRGSAIIHLGGQPADIGVDTKRNRVAVPFVDRNLVEIWQLPPQ
jgi:hypothetical protein